MSEDGRHHEDAVSRASLHDSPQPPPAGFNFRRPCDGRTHNTIYRIDRGSRHWRTLSMSISLHARFSTLHYTALRRTPTQRWRFISAFKSVSESIESETIKCIRLLFLTIIRFEVSRSMPSDHAALFVPRHRSKAIEQRPKWTTAQGVSLPTTNRHAKAYIEEIFRLACDFISEELL